MAWRMSKTFHCRPSQLLAIHDEVAAYYLDSAVFYFGVNYELDLEKAGEKAKSDGAKKMAMESVNKRWLNDGLADPIDDVDEFEVVPSDQFVDPAQKFKR